MDTCIWTHLLTLTLCLCTIAAKDFYETLGVKRNATDREIKRRFRELGRSNVLFDAIHHCFVSALKYHPDKNKDSKAEDTFRAIAEAYDVLSDSSKRQQYDTQDQQPYPFASNGYANFQFDMTDFYKHFDTDSSHFQHDEDNQFEFNFESLFDQEDDDSYEANGSYEGNHFDFHDIFSGSGLAGDIFDDRQHVHLNTFGSSQQNCRTYTTRQGHSISTVTECF